MASGEKGSAKDGLSGAFAHLPAEFSGFGDVFEKEIRPALMAREQDRVAAVDAARKSWFIGGGLGGAGVLLGLLVAKAPVIAILSAIAGFGYIGWQSRHVSQLSREAKRILVQPIADQLDLMFTEDPGPVASIRDHRRVGILPSWDRSKFEDRVTGTRNEVDFELFEAHLEEKRTSTDSKGRTQTRWVTVFKGQCLRFAFPKTFYGRTLVTRDAGFFNRFGGGKGMDRASLEDPKFEKIFEVYTTDQVESRYLLTPDLMQRLVDLETAFKGGDLKCSFDGGEMFVTVEGGNLFEPGSMFKSLDDESRISELLHDFASVFHIIDSVLDNRRREDRERSSTP